MSIGPTPRVNSVKLGENVGRTVRLTGKVVKLMGDTALLEASDNGQVTVKLTRESHYADAYVEVIGKVIDDNTIQEYTSMNMGSSINMELIEAVVQMSAKYPDIFPSA